jgi:subtilisin family serine protease
VVVVDPPKDFSSTVGSLGFAITETVSLGDLGIKVVRLRVPSGQTVRSARRLLLGRYPGLVVDANHQFDPSAERRRRVGSGSAADQLKKRRSSATNSRARAAIGWKNVPTTCGRGVRLGMIDSGVDLKHAALVGQNIEFKSFHNRKRRQGPSAHGTSIAAILVGKIGIKGLGGLLPGAELKAANMFEFNKTGKKVGNVIALLKSLNWMAQQKVHVINLSIAGTNNRAVNKAFKVARKKGLVMVAAAGNWGRSDKPAYPAAYSEVLAVTAVGPYRGIYKKANTGDYIEFAAPGVRLWTAVPGGGKYQSGTSFASPYVTALLGLEIAKGAKKNPATLRNILRGSVADLGTAGRDKTYGWGFVEKQPNC